MAMRRVVCLAALAAMAAGLAGCSGIDKAAGLSKDPPDEFAVATKPPLIIPPDYNLKPPKPGAEPLNAVSPSLAAQGALYGDRQPVTSSHGQLSLGEQELLAKAGASDANNMIRQQIAADNKSMQASDESFTNQILFGLASDSSADKPVDANAEAARLKAAKEAREVGKASSGEQAGTATIQKKSDSGGWLDGIF